MARPIRTVSIKVQGFNSVKRRFARMRGLPRNLVNLQRDAADRIVARARELVPVRTGLLYSTIQRRNTPAGAIATAGEPNPNPPSADSIPGRTVFVAIPANKAAPYALIQHESFRSRRPHYLSDAYQEVVEPLREKYLRKAVKKAVKG